MEERENIENAAPHHGLGCGAVCIPQRKSWTHRRSGQPGRGHLATAGPRNILHNWRRRTVLTDLYAGGQTVGQDTLNVKLVLAGVDRKAMYGCYDIDSECTNTHQEISISVIHPLYSACASVTSTSTQCNVFICFHLVYVLHLSSSIASDS